MAESIIAHFDMDAFFAAVEERDKPYLSGLPVVVGADPLGGEGRGVVSTANYAARKYGIKSAIPISAAWRMSQEAKKRGEPAAAFLTGRFRAYAKESKEIFKIARKYSPVVEETSVDEGYLDFTHCGSYEKAAAEARKLKAEIKRKRRLSSSVGIGPNRMIAKIASDFKKPGGFTIITPEEAFDFLSPLFVRAIPGIGPRTEEVLRKRGIRTVADARKLSFFEMEELFGKWGFSLYEKVRGIGSAVLTTHSEVSKSIGEHDTFSKDSGDMRFVTERLDFLAADIIGGMKRQKFRGFRTAVLTVRFADFQTKQRSVTVKRILSSQKDLEVKALKLLLPFFEKKENPQRKKIRMIGLRIEKLQRACPHTNCGVAKCVSLQR